MSAQLGVEIAVQDLEGVRIALEEDAQRIELCSALAVGGLTPSIGLIQRAGELAREAGRPGFVHVLIRPRPGGFVYGADEVEVVVRDIQAAIASGASGVVIGALTDDDSIDAPVTRTWAAAASGAEVTFHRAIDAVADPLAAVDDLVRMGITRVLTSGHAATSIQGVETLRSLAERAAGRIQVMAGGGVGIGDIAALAATGVDAVHLSARRSVTGTASGPGGGDASYDATDRSLVQAAIAAARRAGARP